MFNLFSRDVSIDILATHESIKEDIGCTCQNHYIAELEIAKDICEFALQWDKNTTTANHRHESTRSDRGVFTKTLNRHIEDTAPHH